MDAVGDVTRSSSNANRKRHKDATNVNSLGKSSHITTNRLQR